MKAARFHGTVGYEVLIYEDVPDADPAGRGVVDAPGLRGACR